MVLLDCDAPVIVAAPGPPNCLHVPVPLPGALPPKVTLDCKHTTWSAPALAGVTAWYTVMIVVSLGIAAHTPLCTIARYQVVAVKFVYVLVVVVLLMLVHVVPLLVLYSHLNMLPV